MTESPLVRWTLTAVALAFLLLFILVPAANVFAQALKKGVGAYAAVLYPKVDPAREDHLRTTLADLVARQRKEQRDFTRALGKLNLPDEENKKRLGELGARHQAEKKPISGELNVLVSGPEKAQATWSAIRLTLSGAAVVVPLNLLFGVAAAWAITKFRFRGRSFLISLVDLPFSVSPVVAGLVFVFLFGRQGAMENWLDPRTGPTVAVLVLLPMALVGAWMLTAIARAAAEAAHRIRPGPRRDPRAPARLRVKAMLLITAMLAAVSVARWATDAYWSWAWLPPSGWTWPEPAGLYWRGFGNGHWWPLGASAWQTGVIFTPLAIVLASTFVTFPFVARSLIPLMESQGSDEELAAISLGAGGWRTFWRVTLPNIKWGILYGVILCTARAFGEFGAVSVVSGGVKSNETMPLRVQSLWESADTQAAFTVASMLASLAVLTLVAKAVVEWRTREDLSDATPAATVAP